jgi:HTH-type transcriptional regulator / antitoxin HigA
VENMSIINSDLLSHWSVVEPLLSIRNGDDYNKAVQRLNYLIDEVGTNQQHPLYSLLDTLGTLIQAYEDEHWPMPEVNGVEALHYLMQEHGLTQSDLPEVGSQGVVSEILHGKRMLNARQIRALAARFNVSPALFF